MWKLSLLGGVLGVSLCDDFELEIYFDGTEIVMETGSPDGSWLGLLLGSGSMSDTDAISFHADGASSKARDFHAEGYTFPIYDSV